jgi:hypothetical protein
VSKRSYPSVYSVKIEVDRSQQIGFLYLLKFLATVRDMLDSCEFYKIVPKSQFFPTIHDAVLCATLHIQTKQKLHEDKEDFVKEIFG